MGNVAKKAPRGFSPTPANISLGMQLKLKDYANRGVESLRGVLQVVGIPTARAQGFPHQVSKRGERLIMELASPIHEPSLGALGTTEN